MGEGGRDERSPRRSARVTGQRSVRRRERGSPSGGDWPHPALLLAVAGAAAVLSAWEALRATPLPPPLPPPAIVPAPSPGGGKSTRGRGWAGRPTGVSPGAAFVMPGASGAAAVGSAAAAPAAAPDSPGSVMNVPGTAAVARATGAGAASPGGVGGGTATAADPSLSDVAFVAENHSPQVRACYERSFRHDPAAPAGRIELSFTLVDAGDCGRAVDVTTELNLLGSAAVASCVSELLAEWRFPRPQPPAPRRLRYPFVFAPAAP